MLDKPRILWVISLNDDINNNDDDNDAFYNYHYDVLKGKIVEIITDCGGLNNIDELQVSFYDVTPKYYHIMICITSTFIFYHSSVLNNAY